MDSNPENGTACHSHLPTQLSIVSGPINEPSRHLFQNIILRSSKLQVQSSSVSARPALKSITVTKLWQSCRDPHPKIHPITFLGFFILQLQSTVSLHAYNTIFAQRCPQRYSLDGCLWIVDDELEKEW